MNHTAIVVIAYNRLNALKQLLDSINNAIYPDTSISLVISIDKSNNKEIASLVKEFEWHHGNKELIFHEKRLGLIKHVFYCAGLTNNFDNVILLEDDLIVSPYFYMFSEKACAYYQHEERVTGISLYNYCISESSLLSFIPIDDGSDVYFMQYPSSWGLCLNKKNWQLFLKSYVEGELSDDLNDPPFVRSWPNNSWKRFMIRYLNYYNKYFVFPRLSLTSNFSKQGTNTPVDLNIFHVPLQMSYKDWRFVSVSESKAIYDTCFEITPESLNKFIPAFSSFNYIVDLQGVRDLKQTKATHIVTTRKTNAPLMTYGSQMKPLVFNLINNIQGTEIRFSLLKNTSKKNNNVHYGHTEFVYKYMHQNLSNKFSFIKYFYFYISFELKMYWKRIKK